MLSRYYKETYSTTGYYHYTIHPSPAQEEREAKPVCASKFHCAAIENVTLLM